MTETTKLKPCPFCGNQELEGPVETDSLFGEGMVITCKCCIVMFRADNAEEAEKAWNERD